MNRGLGRKAIVIGLGPWSYVLANEAMKFGLDVRGYVSRHSEGALDGRPVVGTLTEAIRGWHPDVAIVATRPERTAQQVHEALASGLHVFAEKPVALGVRTFSLVKSEAQKNELAVTVDYTIARQVLASLGSKLDAVRRSGPHDVVLRLPPKDHGVSTSPHWSVRWLPHLLSLAFTLAGGAEVDSPARFSIEWRTSAKRLTAILQSGTAFSLQCADDGHVREVVLGEGPPIYLAQSLSGLTPVQRGLREFGNRISGLPRMGLEVEGPSLEVSRLVSLGLSSWLEHLRQRAA